MLASQIPFQRTGTICGWPQPVKADNGSKHSPLTPAFLLGGAFPPQACGVSLFTCLSCPFTTHASSCRGETEGSQPRWKRR